MNSMTIPYRRYPQSGINKLKKKVWSRDNYTCRYCGLKMFDSYLLWKNGKARRKDCPITVDHVHPKSKGGEWSTANLVTACKTCNLEKADTIIISQENIVMEKQNIITITLSEDENIVDALKEVACLVEKGYTSGYVPTWKITKE